MDSSPVLCPDGHPATLLTLVHDCGVELSLMDWGATWLSLRVPVAGKSRREVLLGCAHIPDYFRQTAYLNATIGRYANRIGRAQIARADEVWRLRANQGPHQLHGGPQGFDKRRWRILDLGQTHVTLVINSPHGDQGFPGNLSAEVTYRLLDDCRISQEFTAQVDAPSPVCLTNHAYFNLDGQRSDIRQHTLRIHADRFAPIDDSLIPTGDLLPVTGSGFDFTKPKQVAQDFGRDAQQQITQGYDHAFLLDAQCSAMQVPAASLSSADKHLHMDLYTTEPALQFYSGNALAGTPARDGGVYEAWQGLALEPECLPDSPNHPEWPQPDCWLRPGSVYRHTTLLHFRS